MLQLVEIHYLLYTDDPMLNMKRFLSIAAIDKDNSLYSFSSSGKIDFVSEGDDVQTINSLGEAVKESGSSMATANFVGILMSYSRLMVLVRMIPIIKN